MRTIALLAVLCAAPTVVAQPASDPAEAIYQEGKRLYDLREWDHAIAKFKEAYKLRSDAASLFNIAQSYRLKGDCVEAVNFYKTYRRLFPKEKAVEKANKFITELDECAKQRAATVKTEPVTEPVKTEPVKTEPVKTEPVKTEPVKTEPVAEALPVEPEEQRAGGGGLRIAGIVVGGIGIAAIGTGIYFGLQASSKADELENATVWDQDLFDRGKRADRNAKILLGVGGAAVVGGVVLFILGKRAGSEPAQVGFVPTRGGASLVWSCEL